MKHFSLFCFFILIISTIDAQNLINNSGFDDYNKYIDSNHNLVYRPELWNYDTTKSSHPFYFSSDRFQNKFLTLRFHPDSILIKQGQKVNYISILLLPYTEKTYTVLKEPLKKGVKYHLKVDIKAFDLSTCLSDLLIGFKDCSNCNMDSSLYLLRLPIPDSLCNYSLFQKWVTLKADFMAIGNEKVLVISSGTPKDYMQIVNSDPNKFIIKGNQLSLNYFIDNVYLIGEGSDLDHSLIEKIDSLTVGESIILDNVYFDFDEYVLLKSSFPILDKIYNYLEMNKNIKVQISGYTDNVGNQYYNYGLSTKRAKAILKYLTDKGIAKDRLQSIGYGAKFPIDSNDTEVGRQKNRRIEVKVIDK